MMSQTMLFILQVLMDMEVNESNWTTTILTVMQSNIYNVAQRAKKVVSDSPGLVDFPIGLVNWAIPENIHTIPWTALRISEGEGGFTIMEF